MRNFYLLILVTFFFSCKPKKEGLYAYNMETKLPYKFVLGNAKKDSTVVLLMIPQKVRFENNLKKDLRLSDIHFTLKGGGAYNHTHGVLYEFINDSLQNVDYKKKIISSHSKEIFELYIRYKTVATKELLSTITKDTIYDQMYLERPMYKTYSIEQDNLRYNLIPLSKRGYIRFSLYDKEVNGYTSKVIPVQF